MRHYSPDRRPRLRRNAGFSMVELAVAVTVIILLSGILIPVVSEQLDKSKIARAAADAKRVADAMQKYHLDTGEWPIDTTNYPETILFRYLKAFGINYPAQRDFIGFPCFFTAPSDVKGWNGPYLQNNVGQGSSKVVARASSGSSPAAGFVDPWGKLYRFIMVFMPSSGQSTPGFVSLLFGSGATTTGMLFLVSAGPNGVFETTYSNAVDGVQVGDDICVKITPKLY